MTVADFLERLQPPCSATNRPAIAQLADTEMYMYAQLTRASTRETKGVDGARSLMARQVVAAMKDSLRARSQ